jgi:FAD/FMN-containing dehydrogenase
LIIFAIMVYAGEVEAGERALAPFRALAKPLADMLKPMHYPEIYAGEQEGYHPIAASRTMFVDHIDRSVAETILIRLQASSASMAVAQLRVLGGAMARVPVDATAFAHRTSKIMVNVAALYEKPEEKSKHEAWVTDFAAALQQSDKGLYVNFLGDEGEARIRAAYPGSTWDRLAEVKARYDPTNLFRLNQNIPPSER